MARREPIVLRFPMNPIAAPDSMLRKAHDPPPHAVVMRELADRTRLLSNPEIVALHFQHEFLRIERLKCAMSPAQTVRLAYEWPLLAKCLDEIEAEIKHTVERQAKACGLIA